MTDQAHMHGQLARSLKSITLGTARAIKAREQSVADQKLQELEQQFQIPISGTARQGITWARKELDFSVTLIGAASQRDSPLNRPQHYYGVEKVTPGGGANDPTAAVIVSVVVEYKVDDSGATTGCFVDIGIHSPTVDPVQFNGYVHLTFQGYGSPLEDESDADE